MGIKRINEFPEGSGLLSSDDVFIFMDNPSGSGVTKKISLSEISNAIGAGSSDRLVNGDKEVVLDASGSLTLPSGSILSETNNTLSLMPPTAVAGQSLVIRATNPTGITSDHSGGFAAGDTITITITPDNGNVVTGTVDYTFTGDFGIGELGNATTGTLTFTSQANQTLTWTVPAESAMTTFTFTLSNSAGFGLGGLTELTLTGTGSSEDSHIHLISGDPTTVDIYLGDDDQYVKIEKDGGDVVIGTNSDTNHWIFGGDGSLTLPASGGFIFPDSTTQTSAGIPSSTGLVPNSTSITNIVSISQANYDALTAKDSSTLYVIS